MPDTLELPPADFSIEFAPGAVKAAMREAGATTYEALMVPLDSIKIVAGLNIRIHDTDYDDYCNGVRDSIIENGFYRHKPLSGYAAKEGELNLIYCTGGFTRLEAAKRAKAAGAPIEKVPVVMQPAGTSMIDLMVELDTDNKHRPLKPYERAVNAKRLLSYGCTEADICRRLGMTDQYLKDLLYMMSLPKALQGMVTSGKVAAKHVVILARKVGAAEALKSFEASLPKSEEDEDEAFSTPTGGARVTARNASLEGRKPSVPKKTIFLAIDYALQLPSGGLPWLKKWRGQEEEAVAELSAYKPPRKNAKTKTGKGKNGKDDDPVFATRKKKPGAEAVKNAHGDDAPL